MDIHLPKMYKKNIFEINYDLLKENGVKAILFDFDNTIIEKEKLEPNQLDIDLFNKLKKDFKVIVVSNTIFKKKIDHFSRMCSIDYVMDARKPSHYGFLKIERMLNLKGREICMVGDQLLTDIKGGNKRNYYTVLVDPIKSDSVFLTKIHRLREYFIYKKLEKNNTFIKGRYYE